MESEDTNADGELTLFARLPAEIESEASTSNGILGTILGRFFGTKEESTTFDVDPPVFQSGDPDLHASHPDGIQSGDLSSLTDNLPEGKEDDVDVDRASETSSTSRRKLSDRLSSLFRSRKQCLNDYNRSDIRRYWMPDSTGRECYECRERFTTFRRRHHCRLCGQIFCSKCCSFLVPGALLGYMGDLRLCAYCARIVMSYLPQADSTQDSSTASTPVDEGTVVRNPSNNATISTVSSGPMMWEAPTPSISLNPAPGVSPSPLLDNDPVPSLLSVCDLAVQHERGTFSLLSTERSFMSVDDREPEWVRSMEMTNDPGKRNESFAKVEDMNSTRSSSLLDDICDTRCNGGSSTEEQLVKSPSSASRPRFQINATPPIGVDLEKSFDEKARNMLSYLCERELLHPELWWDVIWSMSHRVCSLVSVDVEGRRDNINILNYVHIKKLCVPEKPSAHMVQGVVCSKSVTHGAMPTHIQNAAVMVLAGSVEYERVTAKLSSIDAIIAQEVDYLSNQVDRILAQRPSVVLVEENVAHVAVNLLKEAGVSLVSNLKTNVLKRVARSTRADVMPSLDAQLLQQRIGFCPLFAQHKLLLANGNCKTLLAFSECDPELGCSVLLRGSSPRELRAAKRVLRHMVVCLYSNRIELEMLTMFGVSVTQRSSDCLVCSLNADRTDPGPESFTQRLKECTLSSSPFIHFGVPFLETAKGRSCVLRPYFRRPLYRFSTRADFELARKDAELAEEFIEKENGQERGLHREAESLHAFVCDREMRAVDEDELASFRASSGRIFCRRIRDSSERDADRRNERTDRHEDVLDPYIHQRIAVLFGSFSPKSPNAPFFCVRPWVLQMDHYGTNDMCLGDFLRKFCFNNDYQCPSTNCEVPMLEHCRKMVYRNVCVEITTQNCVQSADDTSPLAQSAQDQSGSLLAWNYCPSCKASSSVVVVSESVLRLSFARYLDYLVNGMFATCAVSSFNRECNHCSFHQHDHYFALNSYVASFKVHPVRPFHVMFSPVVCTVEPSMFTRKFVAEKSDEISQTADGVFKVMNSQLERFHKASDSHRYISFYTLLSTLLQQAQSNFNELLDQFDVNGALLTGSLTIRSNDGVYIQAMDTVVRCRHVVERMTEQWNEQEARLTHSVRSFKKSASSAMLSTAAHTINPLLAPNHSADGGRLDVAGEATGQSDGTAVVAGPSLPATEVELMAIESSFPPQLHLSLPPSSNGVAAVVRDLLDLKGSAHPDIGSIVAYALSSNEYQGKCKGMRELRSSDGVAANLKSNPTENDVIGDYEHIEMDFADSRAQYFVKVYYAERFHILRKLLFVEGEDSFIRSLAVSSKWNPQGGKSGASFYRTEDERFVFKQMSRFEIQSFVKFAPNYFDYISTAVTENKLTTLCKVYGVYRIGYKNKQTGQHLKLDVLVMEFLFYKRNVKQVWDLKGSQRNRMASEGKRTSDLVLLDENLVKDLWNNQLYVHPHSKAALNMAISNDSHFLSAQHVMDYSLLVGVDEANDELILGIVDYMRTYTLDKKLESWVKIVAIPGAHLPTVISPEMYCTRFSDAIDTYFPVAPDQWTGLGSAMSY